MISNQCGCGKQELGQVTHFSHLSVLMGQPYIDRMQHLYPDREKSPPSSHTLRWQDLVSTT